jgi:dolichol-phosphate mannosyltransferase
MMSFPLRELSLACPAYNEADGLEVIVKDWLSYLHKCQGLECFEIVICNDGSRDSTGTILDKLASSNTEVKPVHHKINQGAGAALASAISSTRMEWVLLIDADGQFPVDNIMAMAGAIYDKNGVAAIGIRQGKKDTLFARFGSWSSGALCNLFHGTKLQDFNCAFKLVSGSVIRSLVLEAKGLNYSTEITSKLLEKGVDMVEVKIRHLPRAHGTSSLRAIRGAIHRFLLVLYIGLRQLLLRLDVLRVVKVES